MWECAFPSPWAEQFVPWPFALGEHRTLARIVNRCFWSSILVCIDSRAGLTVNRHRVPYPAFSLSNLEPWSYPEYVWKRFWHVLATSDQKRFEDPPKTTPFLELGSLSAKKLSEMARFSKTTLKAKMRLWFFSFLVGGLCATSMSVRFHVWERCLITSDPKVVQDPRVRHLCSRVPFQPKNARNGTFQ